MKTSPIALRLEPELRRQLDRLAKVTQRSRSFLAAEAIRDYVAMNEWQIEETRRALQEADRDEFASEQEVQRVVEKWRRPSERKARPRTRRAG